VIDDRLLLLLHAGATLVATNWVRTFAWSARGVLALWLLA
jgi:hypothetical protein